MAHDLVLSRITGASIMLAEARTIQDAKHVVDVAEAARIYAKRIKASRETTNFAAEVRLRAERLLGEMLKAAPKNPGVRMAGKVKGRIGGSILAPPKTPTLADSGIDKKMSSRAQQLAEVPKAEFEAALAHKGDLNPNRVSKELRESRQRDDRAEKRVEAAKSAPDIPLNIIIGDFRKQADKVADGSLSLIFTDPPYDREASKMLPALGEFAANKLADGGSLILYVGQTQIFAAGDALRQHLRYWWTIACIHSGRKTVMREYGINAGWKAVLWFVKNTRDDKQTMVNDVMSGGEEKTLHPWQQAQSEAAYWIEKLTTPDGIICDPFLGSGTTGAAAKSLGRKWIGFEIDPETAALAARRIASPGRH